MAVYQINTQKITMTVHKENCPTLPQNLTATCRCTLQKPGQEEFWYCEDHLKTEMIDRAVGNRYWTVIFCPPV